MSDGVMRIGELSRRTGVSPELLRAWEQRYGLLEPTRSPGGFRLYSPTDEERVRRTAALIAEGLSAAEAARLAATTPEVAAPASAPDPFVGREEVLATLASALDEAGRGRGRFVILSGEPGIGKTRCARELALRAETQGVPVLRARWKASLRASARALSS